MPAYRLILRAAMVLCLLSTVLFSASCGCGGGGSKSTPSPGNEKKWDDPVKTYYPPPVKDWNRKVSNYRNDRWSRNYYCDRLTRARLIRERWLPGAGYQIEAEHRNVKSGSADSTTDWRSLMFTPRCGSDCLPDSVGAASAIYALSSDMLGDNQVYLELTWENRPSNPDNLWVALLRPGQGDEAWNWFRPGEDMRIALTPISQYQHQTVDEKIYLAVALTGMDSAVLRKVALREYEANLTRRSDNRCRDDRRYKDNYLYDDYHGHDNRYGHYKQDHYRDEHRCDDYRRDDYYYEESSNALLTLSPQAFPGDPPGSPGAAEVLYTFNTDDFQGHEVYLELDWYLGPVVGDCWVGVFRPRAGEQTWNWFKPNEKMRVALSPIDEYQSSYRNEPVYVKVVVTGNLPCELEMVNLSEYEFDFID